ncbi:hypothetical protein [Burkholderia cenocepacia]|nr:hypothetical protein [Burkholderia cenocepacia]
MQLDKTRRFVDPDEAPPAPNEQPANPRDSREKIDPEPKVAKPAKSGGGGTGFFFGGSR